jgi:DNA-binding transcriptional LysR family regulator
MELRHLRYFLMVAETLHFGRAAERLHIGQQPLSFQIKQLEDELGVVLFKRTTRSVALTAAGEALLADVQAGLDRIDRGVDAAQRIARGETGTLHVGYTSTTLYSVMPPIVRTFREQFPEVEIVLRELHSPTLEQLILEGEIDVGIVVSDDTWMPGIAYEPIYQEPVAVALPRDHHLARQATIALSDLADEPFVMYSRRVKRQAFDAVIALCHVSGFSPRIVQEAASEPAVIGLVAAGMGVALVGSSLSSVRADEVAYRPLDDPPLVVQVSVVWKQEQEMPLVQKLRPIAQEVAERYAAPEMRSI